MAVDRKSAPAPADDVGRATATLVRRALKGALGTLDRGSGHPYASLVTVAVEPAGSPVLLISRLALHTLNLEADPRASLMIDGTAGDGDPLAGGRVTLVGTCRPTSSATARGRFLARHPGAEMYASFADFGFYGLEVERAHYVGGFGRIVDLEPARFLTPEPGAGPLAAAEAEIVAHMNTDHSDALGLVAQYNAAPGSGWRMTGIDSTGIDMVSGVETLRVWFDGPIRTPADARRVLVELTQRARAALS